jgi:hypothetical protein
MAVPVIYDVPLVVDEFTFPTMLQIKNYLEQQKRNQLFNLIKNKIISSDLAHIIVTTEELVGYPSLMVTHLKQTLRNKDYTLVERENAQGVSIGFKISWE